MKGKRHCEEVVNLQRATSWQLVHSATDNSVHTMTQGEALPAPTPSNATGVSWLHLHLPTAVFLDLASK